jgi:hypothetical protein
MWDSETTSSASSKFSFTQIKRKFLHGKGTYYLNLLSVPGKLQEKEPAGWHRVGDARGRHFI